MQSWANTLPSLKPNGLNPNALVTESIDHKSLRLWCACVCKSSLVLLKSWVEMSLSTSNIERNVIFKITELPVSSRLI